MDGPPAKKPKRFSRTISRWTDRLRREPKSTLDDKAESDSTTRQQTPESDHRVVFNAPVDIAPGIFVSRPTTAHVPEQDGRGEAGQPRTEAKPKCEARHEEDLNRSRAVDAGPLDDVGWGRPENQDTPDDPDPKGRTEGKETGKEETRTEFASPLKKSDEVEDPEEILKRFWLQDGEDVDNSEVDKTPKPSNTTHTGDDGSTSYFSPPPTTATRTFGYTTPGYEWASRSRGYKWYQREEIYGYDNPTMGEAYHRELGRRDVRIQEVIQEMTKIREEPIKTPEKERGLIGLGYVYAE